MHDLIYDIETTGLEPMNGDIIIAIGCTVDGKPEVFYGDDEKKVLTEFWEYLNSTQVRRFVGYNNAQFDDHFLFYRTVINDLPYGFNFLDYNASLDLRPFVLKLQKKLYGSQKFTKGKLTDVARGLGIDMGEISEDISGANMQEAYKNKDWASIYKHQEDDIKLTWALFQKVKHFVPKVKTHY